jgi:hypothetical protein
MGLRALYVVGRCAPGDELPNSEKVDVLVDLVFLGRGDDAGNTNGRV